MLMNLIACLLMSDNKKWADNNVNPLFFGAPERFERPKPSAHRIENNWIIFINQFFTSVLLIITV